MASSLVVKVTVGVESAEKCAQAFTVAAVAATSGIDVSLWLTGESAWLALPGRAEQVELDHSPALSELRDTVLASGQITLCTQCAARRGIEPDALIPGIRIAGASTFVAEALADDTQALVY